MLFDRTCSFLISQTSPRSEEYDCLLGGFIPSEILNVSNHSLISIISFYVIAMWSFKDDVMHSDIGSRFPGPGRISFIADIDQLLFCNNRKNSLKMLFFLLIFSYFSPSVLIWQYPEFVSRHHYLNHMWAHEHFQILFLM